MDKRLDLIGDITGAEKLLLAGRQRRGEDLESAVKVFLEFLELFHRADTVEDALRVIHAECGD